MTGLLLTIYILVCIILIIAVMMQSGKGGSLSSLFGGGGEMFFGATGVNKFLNNLTTILGILFFVLSLFLSSNINRRSTRTVMPKNKKPAVEKTAPQQELPLNQAVPDTAPADTGIPEEIPGSGN